MFFHYNNEDDDYVADVYAFSSPKTSSATPRLPLSKLSLCGSVFATGSPLCKHSNYIFNASCLFLVEASTQICNLKWGWKYYYFFYKNKVEWMLRFSIIHKIVCYQSCAVSVCLSCCWYNLGSMDTSFEIPYLCHTGVVSTLSCYNFSCRYVISLSVSVVPRVQLVIWKEDFLLQFLLLRIM